MNNTAFSAVVFDLDGTLLDTLDDLADSMNAVLERRGLPIHDRREYQYFVGEGIRVLTIRALPLDCRDEKTVNECADEMRTEYARRYLDKTKPYPGITDLLTWLTANNIQMAVLSNKPDLFTKELISRLLGAWHFQVVQGEAPGFPRKPDPAGAHKIVEALKIPPAQILYVGDTATDMMTARAAGMMPIGVLWGFRAQKELVDAGARRILAHPMDLISMWD